MKAEVISGPFDRYVGRQVLTRISTGASVIVDLNGCYHSLEKEKRDVDLAILEYRLYMVRMAIGKTSKANLVRYRATTASREFWWGPSAQDESDRI